MVAIPLSMSHLNLSSALIVKCNPQCMRGLMRTFCGRGDYKVHQRHHNDEGVYPVPPILPEQLPEAKQVQAKLDREHRQEAYLYHIPHCAVVPIISLEVGEWESGGGGEEVSLGAVNLQPYCDRLPGVVREGVLYTTAGELTLPTIANTSIDLMMSWVIIQATYQRYH